MRTYHRTQEEHEVTEVTETRVQFGSWSMPKSIFPDDVAVGQRYITESVLGSTPSAVFRCTWRKSDEDLDADHEAFSEQWKKEKHDRLEESRDEWTLREAALPQVLQDRLNNFRKKAAAVGNDFEVEGWGYELVVSELAAMYAEQGDPEGPYEDTAEIVAYASKEGTSGNQHGFAKALARGLIRDPEQVQESISALTPLGTGAYYDKVD